MRDLLPDLRWHTFALSSGEDPLDGDDEARKGGEKVRHIDIPVLGHAAGIFNRVSQKHGVRKARKEGAALAAQVESTIGSNFDVAFRPYVRWLLKNSDEAKQKARLDIDGFIERMGATQDPYHARLARKFGVVLAGMLLAVEAGVAPWDAKRARQAVRHLYRLALAQITTDDERAGAALQAIRDKVLDGTLVEIKKGQNLNPKADGFIRATNRQKLVHVNGKFLKQHFKGSAAPETVLKKWVADHLMFRDASKKIWTKQVKVIIDQEPTKSYWYVFDHAALMTN